MARQNNSGQRMAKAPTNHRRGLLKPTFYTWVTHRQVTVGDDRASGLGEAKPVPHEAEVCSAASKSVLHSSMYLINIDPRQHQRLECQERHSALLHI
jgi:hypothetical protein